jgi:hypothetical protein
MIDYTLDTARSILSVRPKDALTQEDFTQLAEAVDPHIEKTGGLAGIIIEIIKFPGWNTFAALAAHIRFLRDHHRHIKKVAVVTDSAVGALAEKLASHFVAAEIKQFSAGEVEAAKRWIVGG